MMNKLKYQLAFSFGVSAQILAFTFTAIFVCELFTTADLVSPIHPIGALIYQAIATSLFFVCQHYKK